MTENAMMTPHISLMSLPPELHLSILSHLPAVDLILIRLVSHHFSHLVDRDYVWTWRASKDFGIKLKVGPNRVPHRLLYQRLLHKYAPLCGMWQRQNLKFYSGLLKVEWDCESQCLMMNNLLPTPDLTLSPVRQRFLNIGMIKVDGEWKVAVTNMDRMTNAQNVKLKIENDRLEIVNSNMRDYITSPSEWRQLLAEFRSIDPEGDTELALMKFISLYHSRSMYTYMPLFFPFWLDRHNFRLDGTPISPGLFKGTYGGHGVEFVHLQVQGATMEGARGVKVTGDPNVPFNEITFKITDGSRCLDVPLEYQETLDELINFMTEPFYVPYTDDLCLDFVVPRGMRERASVKWNTCKGRWAAEAQIASHMFQNPQFTPANFILFSEDEFAVIFLELNVISMFHREK